MGHAEKLGGSKSDGQALTSLRRGEDKPTAFLRDRAGVREDAGWGGGAEQRGRQSGDPPLGTAAAAGTVKRDSDGMKMYLGIFAME